MGAFGRGKVGARRRWQRYPPKRDRTYANQLKSAEILERLFKQNSEHPGVAHYLVHAYDYPALASKGISIAGQYAQIAPAAPHARHMPSHIYSMVGMWEESIASNRSALEVQPDHHHATDFMVYAYLQLAQDAKAKALVDVIVGLPPREYPLANFTAVAAIPARYGLERADWAGAAVLPISATGRVMADSLTRFARGLGMARSGDPAGANREIQAVTAWVAHAEGAGAQATKLMRAAADGEDGSVKHVAMENRLYPMRELLGELLLQVGQPAAALAEYEASLKENPNRYRSLSGAALAAEAAGDRVRAAGYFEKLVALSSKADTTRPGLAHARAFLGRR